MKISRRSDGGKSTKMSFKNVRYGSQKTVSKHLKCLYDRAKHLITTPSVISKEKKHLSSVLVSNGYPSSFIRKLTKTARPTANNEPTQEFKSTAVLPYIKGVSEVLRRCLQQQRVRTVFKSDTTLRFLLSTTERRSRTRQTRRCCIQNSM